MSASAIGTSGDAAVCVALGDSPAPTLETGPLSADAYLRAALARDDVAAIGVVQDAVRAGWASVDVMLEILQPAQVEVGRLWAEGEVEIADEQYLTSLTRQCMLLLSPAVPAQRWAEGPRIVTMAVGPHELGVRMISDLMRQAGWQTTYFGNNATAQAALPFVAAARPTVLAISVTLASQIDEARAIIAAVRAHPRCAKTSVLVGGAPFTHDPMLVDVVGADGWGRDAREALGECQRWLADLAAPTSIST